MVDAMAIWLRMRKKTRMRLRTAVSRGYFESRSKHDERSVNNMREMGLVGARSIVGGQRRYKVTALCRKVAKLGDAPAPARDIRGEIWRPFFAGNYAVSNMGRVKRLTPGRKTWPGRLMEPVLLKIGYYYVGPTWKGRNVPCLIHRLVAEAFIGKCPKGHEVNHLDGVKTNNRVANLEYVTHAGNMGHALRTGLLPRGDRHRLTKISDAQVVELRALYDGGEKRLMVLARRFGISRPTVCQLVHRQRRA